VELDYRGRYNVEALPPSLAAAAAAAADDDDDQERHLRGRTGAYMDLLRKNS